ncbi:MAG: response regulator [Syntrophomonas sp.]
MRETTKNPIKVLTVNTHPVTAQGIKSVLVTDQRYVVEAVYNVNDCMKKITEYQSDIVLIDLDLSDISTIDLIRFLTVKNIKVVIMAELDPKDYVPVFSQGVSGFLPKNCSPHELLEAMHNVYYNHIYLSPGLN